VVAPVLKFECYDCGILGGKVDKHTGRDHFMVKRAILRRRILAG
jgi:hypothetical protein